LPTNWPTPPDPAKAAIDTEDPMQAIGAAVLERSMTGAQKQTGERNPTKPVKELGRGQIHPYGCPLRRNRPRELCQLYQSVTVPPNLRGTGRAKHCY
jgi:hypothetical protein